MYDVDGLGEDRMWEQENAALKAEIARLTAERDALLAALRPFALFSPRSVGVAEYGDDATEDRILTRADFDRALEILIGVNEQEIGKS